MPRLNVLELQRQIRSHAQAGHRARRRLRDRRRPRAARRLRPDDRGRERDLRPDRAEGRLASTPATARRCWRASVGHKKAREIWYLCRQYDAQQALEMGLVNTVVPLERAGGRGRSSGRARSWRRARPRIRFLKAAFNADADGLAGLQQLAGDATMLYYTDRRGEGGQPGVRGEAQARLLDASRVDPEASSERDAPRLPASTALATLAAGRPAADAAGRGRAGAGRHLAWRCAQGGCRAGRGLRLSAPSLAADPGRREPRQRLLRLPHGCRLDRPARADPRAAASGLLAPSGSWPSGRS